MAHPRIRLLAILTVLSLFIANSALPSGAIASPKPKIDRITAPAASGDVELVGRYLYYAAEDAVEVVDISRPGAPNII
jgi:hypothetical protein